MSNGKLLTFLLCGLLVSLVYAGVTNLSSLTLSGDLIVGDDATITDDIGVTGDLTVTGTATANGLLGLQSDANPNTNITPTAVGQIVFDSTLTTICVSTAAADNSWAVSGSTTTACS